MKAQSHRRSCGAHLLELDLRLRIAGIHQHGDRRHRRHDLLQELQALCAKFGGDDAEAGGVAARSRKILHQACGDRVGHDGDHKGDGPGCSLERLGGRRSAGDDDVDLALHELCCELGQQVNAVVGPFPFDRDRLSFDAAEFTQATDEGLHALRERGGGARNQHPNSG